MILELAATILLSASVPDHGQSQLINQCPPDYILCMAETPSAIPDLSDVVAYDQSTRDFFWSRWISPDVNYNEVIHGTGWKECYYLSQDYGQLYLQCEDDQEATKPTITTE